jgi:hypothetical protein
MADGIPGATRPQGSHWRLLSAAVRRATELCNMAAGECAAARNVFIGTGDERVVSLRSARAARRFEAHFKSRSHEDAQEISANYGEMHRAIAALTRRSFWIVPNEVVDREEGPDTYAYVVGREAVVYVAQRFLGELDPQPSGSQSSGRSTVTVRQRVLSPIEKAGTMIHEAAHFRLGAKHAGGVFQLVSTSCERGYGVPDFRSASMNAYCYDHFARCLATDG